MKIPKQAHRVFKGEMFSVYQWPQEMFDGSTAIFEMIKRPDTVQIIVTRGDKILICEQEQPTRKFYFSFLGGRVDEEEVPLATAKRELLEEAGLEATDWELYKVYEPHIKIDWKIYYYFARNCRKVTEPAPDSGEKIKILELNFEQFIELALTTELHAGEFTCDLLRMKLEGTLEEFRKKLFSK